MNDNALEMRFLEVLRALASMTKTELTPYMIARYDAELKTFGYDKVVQALDQFFDDIGTHGKFPSINQIKAKLGAVTFSDEEVARDAISRIRYAIGRFGHNNWDLAKDHIGTLGEHIVQTMGGWETVCSFSSYDDLDFALVQAREYAKVAIKKGNAGKLDEAPALPDGSTQNQHIEGLLKNSLLGPPKEQRH